MTDPTDLALRGLPPYRADLAHTYAFGRFAVHEALSHRHGDVQLVAWHDDMPAAPLASLLTAAQAAGVRAVRHDATVERLRKNKKVDCLAVVSKRSEVLEPHNNHLALVSPSHPGNVGTAIRSMVAFGFSDLAMISPSVDPWGDYVVRASVGSRFAVRCQVFSSLAVYLAEHRRRQVYAFSAAGEVELDDVQFQAPFSLLFGPEWQENSTLADTTRFKLVRIPQSDRVESLNLATSVSIAAYRARHPRSS